MENATEALKTAFAVLVFVIALTVTFSMFSTAKETADTITRSQDTQSYLEDDDSESVLYMDSEEVKLGSKHADKLTKDGYRVVKFDDVASTLYRYNIEKYGVTIITSGGEVLARFDSYTENVMRQWYNIHDTYDTDRGEKKKDTFAERLRNNIEVSVEGRKISPNLTREALEKIYKVKVDGNSQIVCGAPWYGNDVQIIRRVDANISGKDYIYNRQTYKPTCSLKDRLNNKKVVEIVREIDNSKYLEDGEATDLLQEYEMPTIEVIYIVY